MHFGSGFEGYSFLGKGSRGGALGQGSVRKGRFTAECQQQKMEMLYLQVSVRNLSWDCGLFGLMIEEMVIVGQRGSWDMMRIWNREERNL